MGAYQDYLFIAVVLSCFAIAGGIGFVMYRSAQWRPADTVDRTDSPPMFASNDDVPPPRIRMRPEARR